MRNVFKSLSKWFASSTEDFFTASLALFIERNERFRDEFLDWLTPLVKDDLHKRNWTVSAQVPRPSCMGGAVLDMVLSSSDLELWFEHKVGAQLGKYGEKDQIEKYLDTANRAMLGIEDGATSVTWPEKGPEKGYPRVILFYIGRSPKPLDAQRYSGRVYETSRPYGIVAQTLRWRDLWPKANRALADALHGEWGEFEKTLSMQFIGYWRSIPGMWTAAYVGGDWRELLPDPGELKEDESCGFDALWEDLVGFGRSDLGCSTRGWRGYEQNCKLPEERSVDIDRININPVQDVALLRNWDERLGSYVLRLLICPRRDEFEWPAFRSELVLDEKWPVRLRLHRVSGPNQLEVLVGIQGWEQCVDTASRRAVILDAFRQGSRAALLETGLEIQGLTTI